MTMTLPCLLMTLHFAHIGLTEGRTFIIFPPVGTQFLYLNVIRPRVKSYGEISTVTLSPGKMRM